MLQYGCWEINLSLLQGHWMLLPNEPYPSSNLTRIMGNDSRVCRQRVTLTVSVFTTEESVLILSWNCGHCVPHWEETRTWLEFTDITSMHTSSNNTVFAHNKRGEGGEDPHCNAFALCSYWISSVANWGEKTFPECSSDHGRRNSFYMCLNYE